MITLSINGKNRDVDVPGEMPLLWTLRDVVGMTGTKFGCGVGLCGACTIHLDGQPTRSCITPVAAAKGKKITTIEAIGDHVGGQEDPGGLARAGRAAMRLLPIGPDHVGQRAARDQAQAQRHGHRRCDEGKHMPLRHLLARSRGNQAGRQRHRWEPVGQLQHDRGVR